MGERALVVDLAEGARIGRFRLLEKIGEGGMGVVYRAEDERLKREVALKVLRDGDEEGSRRLLREARAAAAVHHPNIAAVFDAGEEDGRVYVAMELVRGRSLRRVLQEGAIAPAESRRIALAIARALAEAHERRLVHRDLKPDNVMLDDRGEVKVLDFGLAKVHARSPEELANAETAEQVTAVGAIIGTAGYMSPEQARGKEVDPRGDVFSFGVLLYEMLTGRQPFRGETALDVIISASRDTPPPPTTVDPRVPAAMDALVARCLAKERDARFASGAELVAALLGADDAPAPQPKPRRAFVAAAAALAIVAVLAVFAIVESRPRAPTEQVLYADVQRGVVRTGATSFALDRRLLNEMLDNVPALTSGLVVSPETDVASGAVLGMRVLLPSGIHKHPILDALGLEGGDRIDSVAGVRLVTPDALARARSAVATLRT